MHSKVKISKETLDAVMRTEMKDAGLQQMKELSAKKDETKLQFNVANEQQKSGKKGLRIIGVMRNIDNIKADPIGYVLYNDVKQETLAYTAQQVAMILGMYPVVNAVLENNKITITDGADTAMLQFDALRNPIGSPTIYVLKRETERVGGKTQEKITFIDNSLTVRQLLSSVIIKEKNAGRLVIANMKVSPAPNSPDGYVLEAKNLDTIPTIEKEIKAQRVATDDAETFRKQQLKMKNHASFVQRIVDYIEACILIQNSKHTSRYTTHLKIGGTSTMHRGFEFVGLKGLTAIMEKEVIPIFEQRYNANFEAALNEVHSNCFAGGGKVVMSNSFFLGKDLSVDANNPVRMLFYRYLFAFRLVKGLYRTVNTYDILEAYNKQKGCSGLPYIVNCDWPLQRLFKSMHENKSDYPYRLASYEDYLSVRNKFWKVVYNNYVDIVGAGLSNSGQQCIMWPMPFRNCDDAISVIKNIEVRSKLPAYSKMLIHICSEAALCENSVAGEEAHYRLNRVLCMSAALMTAYALNLDSGTFIDIAQRAYTLIDSCSSGVVDRKLFSLDFYGEVYKLCRRIDRSKEGNLDYTSSVLQDYVKGAGLFVPYYSPLNKTAPSPHMHWQPIMTSLKKHYHIRNYTHKNFVKQDIKKQHRYGVLWLLDTLIRNVCSKDVTYTISEKSKYYARLKRERAERKRNGMKRYTVLTSVETRAAIAQYLGRPYRARDARYDTNLTRLVYYVNTYSPKNRNKTHELY